MIKKEDSIVRTINFQNGSTYKLMGEHDEKFKSLGDAPNMLITLWSLQGVKENGDD